MNLKLNPTFLPCYHGTRHPGLCSLVTNLTRFILSSTTDAGSLNCLTDALETVYEVTVCMVKSMGGDGSTAEDTFYATIECQSLSLQSKLRDSCEKRGPIVADYADCFRGREAQLSVEI